MNHKEGSCDVIVTYCWNRVGYNILRSLDSHGLSVWAADTSKKNICSVSRFCSGSFVYPDPIRDEESFIDVLSSKVAELKPRMLLPTHDESQVIMRYRERFPKDLLIPYDSHETLERLSNKVSSTALASSCGIPVPKVFSSAKDVEVFPCVLKPAIGNSAKGVSFPGTIQELEDLLLKNHGKELLIEEKVGGTDYSVDCIRWDGFFHASTYRAILTKTEGGGTSTQRETVSVPELESFAESFLDSADFRGTCGIDFKYDPTTGKAAFIEANARFTGGLATQITAGFDIPWILYCLAVNGSYVENVHHVIGTKTKWILGDLITFVGRLLSLRFNRQELKQLIKFKGFDAFDDYRSDDRRAILGEMSYYLKKLVKAGKLNP